MPDERSDRIEQLYHAARERGPDERATFLQQACAGDETLRREVESLRAGDADVRSFLETPALEFMKKMSGEDAGQSLIGRQTGYWGQTRPRRARGFQRGRDTYFLPLENPGR